LDFVDNHEDVAGPLGNPADAPTGAGPETFQGRGVVGRDLHDPKRLAVHQHIVFSVGRCRLNDFGNGLGPR
jgi:hypothetical protein